MRPIEKQIPRDTVGNPKQFKEYTEARGDLINQLGQYCSYCEMKLDSALAVEHVIPKSIDATLRLEWENFLLACPNCNPTKGDKDIKLEDYFWPDRDNTFTPFEYQAEGMIKVAFNLTALQKVVAEETLKLTGLDKHPANRNLSEDDSKKTDRRWINRREAWRIATHSRQRLDRNNTIEMREQITETARTNGYWSIWMTVFQHDTDMILRLIDPAKFPGTCQSCFDTSGKCIKRPSGNI